jgi:hypothetical protein
MSTTQSLERRIERLRRDASYKRYEAAELEAEADELDEEASQLERLGQTPDGWAAHARTLIDWATDPSLTLYDERDVRDVYLQHRLALGRWSAMGLAAEKARVQCMPYDELLEELSEAIVDVERAA